MSDNRQLLLNLCRRNYFHLEAGVIEQWEEEYEDIVNKTFFDKLWVVNDAHHIYRDITSVDGKLSIWGSSVYVLNESPYWGTRYVELHGIQKHPERMTIKELFEKDFPYIDGLIRLKRVRVSPNVLIALKNVPESTYSTLWILLYSSLRNGKMKLRNGKMKKESANIRVRKINCVMLCSRSNSSVGDRPAPRGGTTRPDERKVTTI